MLRKLDRCFILNKQFFLFSDKMFSTTDFTPSTIAQKKNDNDELLYPKYMRKSRYDREILSRIVG